MILYGAEMKPIKSVSVIIPTIEEEAVFELIKRIRKLLGNGTELIVVDKSNNKDYYKRLEKTGARVITQRNTGVEDAIMLGLLNANGKILASIDADGTHDASGLKSGVGMVSAGEADFVLGNRLSGVQSGSMGLYIRFGNWVLSRLFSVVYETKVHDVLTGLFVIDRKAFQRIQDIKPYRAGIAFFAIELARLGYRVRETDIKYYKRRYGYSKLTKSKFLFGIKTALQIIRRRI